MESYSVDLKRGNEVAMKVGDRHETDVGGGTWRNGEVYYPLGYSVAFESAS